MNKNNLREEKYTLRLPGMIPLTALADIAYFSSVTLYALSKNNSTLAVICSILAAVPFLCGFLIYRNYKIVFNSESFIFRSAWGKTFHYRYEDIQKIVPFKNHYKIILRNRKILINGKGNYSRYFREYAQKNNVIIEEVIEKYTVMRESAFLLVTGIASILFGTSCFIAFEDFKSRIIMVIFVILGVLLCLARINSSIRYNEKEIVSRNFLGFEKVHHTDKMSSITMLSHDHIVYFGKEKMLVDCLLTGQDQFFDFVIKKIEKNGKDYMERQKDLFNGHLLFPGQKILTLAILLFVFLAGGLLSQFYRSADVSDYESKSVIFTDAAYDHDIISWLELSKLDLNSNDSDTPFLITGFKEYGNHQDNFFQKMQNGATFHITGYFTNKNTYFVIMECFDADSTIFFSLENAKQAEKMDSTHFAYIFYAIAGTILILFICYVFLVRNLHKCPEMVIFVTCLLGRPSSNFYTKLPPGFLEDDEEEIKDTRGNEVKNNAR